MREKLIKWIKTNDFYSNYTEEQLLNMSEDELINALTKVVDDLCHDS